MSSRLFFTFALILCLICSVQARVRVNRANQLFTEVKDVPLVKRNPSLVEKVREKVKASGCNVNLCFALDGSGSLGNDFTTQQNFVKLITAIVGADDSASFAGTVYGLVNQRISRLTTNAEQFLLDVCDASFPSAPTTFISAGIGFCINELDDPRVAGDVNKIVLLGDGFANFGDLTGPLSPQAIAQQWRDLSDNNALCAVAVGFPSINALTAITGDRNLVLQVTEWDKLLNILDQLVEQICSVEPPAPPTGPPPTQPAPPSGPPPTAPNQVKRCPCKCFIVTKQGVRKRKASIRKARRQCKKRRYAHCSVTSCSHRAFHCCN